jgi:hypothetical protein
MNMKKMNQRKLADILGSTQIQLGAVKHKVAALAKLNDCLQRFLPKEFRPHCRVANVRKDKLILACDYASVATRIRFMAKDLCQQLQAADYPQIQSIHNIVTAKVEETPQQPPAELSLHARRVIEQAAKTIEEPTLKQALARLAVEKKI